MLAQSVRSLILSLFLSFDVEEKEGKNIADQVDGVES